MSVVFFNNDPGIPHTLSVYTDSSASTAIFVSPQVTGVTTVTFHFNAPATPGTYFFRCDIHYAMGMTGSFVVT